jgi:peptidoglycan-associated lipoprotein
MLHHGNIGRQFNLKSLNLLFAVYRLYDLIIPQPRPWSGQGKFCSLGDLGMLKKLLSVAAVMMLVAACETAPGGDGGASGSGNRYGSGKEGGAAGRDMSGAMGELAKNVPDRVFFDYDSSSLDEEGQNTLRAQAEWLNANPSIKVVVEGHCDERGTREYNLALGERRANAAKRFLTSAGVSSGRVTTISYGKERPAVAGSDDSSWAQNRRAVTVVQ